jgi:uncharacterized protein YjiS (DUF1127 family)
VSCHTERDAAAAVAPWWAFSWPAKICRDAVAWLRAGRQRQRERRELLSFLASDHRASADFGVTRDEALSWSSRPFWRD